MLNINKPTKADLDNQLITIANDNWRNMERNHRIYTFFASLTDGDLSGYGYNADDIYAIRAFCVATENMYRFYNQTTLLDNGKPAQYISPLVQTLVI